MRKFFSFLFSFVLIIAIAILLVWFNRASLASALLRRHLGVPVRIESLDLSKTQATIHNLSIGNPKNYRNPTAFTARVIEIDSTLHQIRSDPLVIDAIKMEDLLVDIEHAKDSGETNWSQILQENSKKKSSRHYLIKTLTLKNLTVQVTFPDGSIRRYPTIEYMEFHNISEATGFPLNEIEKAIFNQVMKELFKKFDILKLFKQLLPGLPSLPLPGFQ